MSVDDEAGIGSDRIEAENPYDESAAKPRQIKRNIGLVHCGDFRWRDIAIHRAGRRGVLILLRGDLDSAFWPVDSRKTIDGLLRSLKLPDEDRAILRKKRCNDIGNIEPEKHLPQHSERRRVIFADEFGKPGPCSENELGGSIGISLGRDHDAIVGSFES